MDSPTQHQDQYYHADQGVETTTKPPGESHERRAATVGVACNLACEYCYQDPQRPAGNFRPRHDGCDVAALGSQGQPFVLFGGEPLLLGLAELEGIWAYGFERFGSTPCRPTAR